MEEKMRRFDQESAMATVAVQQLVIDWGYELDINDGVNVAELLTEDCNYCVGTASFRGRDAVVGFYAARLERVRREQKDGIRTQRHVITSIRVILTDPSHASVNFFVVNFSGGGKPPLFDAATPTIVVDGRMACCREADGIWRISEFDTAPVFVGNDPFLNATLLQK
jgi:hypothetical protein